MSDGYDDRLFSGGFRSWVHLARFRWLRARLRGVNVRLCNVVELGCFNARSLSYMDDPKCYAGYDAGWEGGLSLAREQFLGVESVSFHECTKPQHMAVPSGSVDLFIALETLEHLPPNDLEDYLLRISAMMAAEGKVLISVPNEKGVVFLLKQLTKMLIFGNPEKYTVTEFLAAIFGAMSHVERDEHKGFDWEDLKCQMESHFVLESCCGLQFTWLPPSLNPSIGMVFVLK